MTLYVYNPARERIGLVEDVRSLQWLSEYQDAGEIKLVCSATEKNRALLVDGNRLYCTEQPESAIIRQTQIDDDGKDAKLTVRAVLSAARWADRVVMATEQVHNAEAGMLSLTTAGDCPASQARPKTLRSLSIRKSPGEVCWMPKSLSLRRQGWAFGRCLRLIRVQRLSRSTRA